MVNAYANQIARERNAALTDAAGPVGHVKTMRLAWKTRITQNAPVMGQANANVTTAFFVMTHRTRITTTASKAITAGDSILRTTPM